MLMCSGLVKSYQGICVVDHLSFEVRDGEVFALLGSNGAGKTTTIKIILDLVRQEEGVIEKKEGVKIGYSPETPYFPPFLTGEEVMWYYGRIAKIGKHELTSSIPKLLHKVGLKPTKTKIPNYSKGMLQRLALAQALLGNPDFLILDEPTAGLDALGRVEMLNLIEQLKEEGKTILINSHILNDIERISDRAIIIKEGKLLYQWNKKPQQSTESRLKSDNAWEDGKSLEEIFLEVVGGKVCLS